MTAVTKCHRNIGVPNRLQMHLSDKIPPNKNWGELRKSAFGQMKGPASPDLVGYLKLMLTKGNTAPPTNIAVAYALAGDRNKAFEYLEKAYIEQDSELGACIRFPPFDVLKSDPRWAAYMLRLDLPQ
jgi:hypothetical protein